MYLNSKDEKMVDLIVTDQRISIQTASYLLYRELTPNNKKHMSPSEFHKEFKQNWLIFAQMEKDEELE